MITPLDVRKMDFNKKFRGYDVDEVQTSLESIARDMEEQIKENTKLNEQLKITEERLNHFRLMEKTLQDSIVTMQNTLDEKRKSADQEANLIIQEAKHKADDEVKDYTDRIKKLKTEIETLESQKTTYFIRFKNFLLSQMDWLKTMEKEDLSDEDHHRVEMDFKNV